ncbi:beta-ketoacyl-ACP synthase III [Legionella hackeliae]|uniref:Beta-ketoacyl-[acyl-carrier-protein] synthase III n=1 Tax=Legionella hackeliae TaxID=449 RepID=A0A0A8USQ6_LEGHA|nr:beta-ketoacyl-ACP synthase III [Legionella hackeliae]KTD12491.1 3-oxoacyl-ACP synthase [Legionella hackeliae]CEK11905.1 3-oxoacyl-[acyl-carrier-protein] synthase 3 [Legionella hackeliae]STX48675.1 3-oxoacyl-ACP synthase [Legionella hackeliae]
MSNTEILACGGYLPKKIILNEDLESVLTTTDTWITQMTGIKQRHMLAENEDFLDCSYNAAFAAFTEAQISPEEINLIIVATTTPYRLMPSTAAMLQQKLQIHNCIAFDMQAACSGFIYALANAYYFMQSSPHVEYALVLGCDAFSNVIDHSDRTTGILFGDGFGAFLLKRSLDSNRKGIFYCKLGSDGKGSDDLYIPWGIGQGIENLTEKKPYILMNGKQVFKNAVFRFTQEIKQALESTHLTIEDIQYFIPHQANIRILQSVASALDIPMEKIIVSLDKHANTSAASIPLAFNQAYHEGRIKRGDLILLTGFGAGYTWGTTIFEF